MTHVNVKPHPDLDPAAWPLIKHPASGGLLDATGKVPADGRPWFNDGFTARMLTDRAVLRADDHAFDNPVAAPDPAPATSSAQAAAVAAKPATPPLKASSPDPAN